MFRILTRGDDGDVNIGGKHYYSASFRKLEDAKKKCEEWNKTSFTFIQQLVGTQEVWEDVE